MPVQLPAGAENKRGRKAGFWSMGPGAVFVTIGMGIDKPPAPEFWLYILLLIVIFLISAPFGSFGGYLVEVLQKKTH